MKRVARKSKSLLLALVLAMGFLFATSGTAYAVEDVSYVEKSWDGTKVVSETKTAECALITKDTENIQGWYYVSGDIETKNRIKVAEGAEANIILTDGSKLTLEKGINVYWSSKLNIYAQQGETGELVCYADTSKENAPIGSDNNSGPNGSITIHGGKITANNDNNEAHAAGIGAGKTGAGGTITIYGGTIEARGGNGSAGIGGGDAYGPGRDGGKITIYGGDVKAYGGGGAAGIGGGRGGNGGVITIWGGKVYAKGGPQSSYSFPNDSGAGIGSGDDDAGSTATTGGTISIYGGEVEAYGGPDGAGIGGGDGCIGGYITIAGGTVKASSNGYASGIGAGDDTDGRVNASIINITGGTIEATGGKYGAGIGGGEGGGGGNINISGGAVTASAGSDAAGIGGGKGGNGDNVTISGGTVVATGNAGGAGIGGGDRGAGTTITISGGHVDATGGANGAGIGNGEDGTGLATTITLKYAEDEYDISVKATSYRCNNENTSVTLTMENPFTDKGTREAFAATSYTAANLDTLNNKTLVRASTFGVTVSKAQGGSVVVGKSRAVPGSTVTLTVALDADGWELKPGTLKAKAGEAELALTQDTSDSSKYTFSMPAADVTVTAEFELKTLAESISISPASATLAVDETKTLEVTASPAEAGKEALADTLTWMSSNEGVATVDADGKVTGIAPGTATITATTSNGTTGEADDKTATCTVTVTKGKPTVVVPKLAAVTYDPAKTLANVELPEGWAWTNGAIVPAVVNEGYQAALAVNDANYDYTGVEGYDAATHKVTRTVPLTVTKATVATPEIASKAYTGEAQTADVPASDLYTVTENEGGTEPGTYDVVLTLKDPANYAWEGVEGPTVTLGFVIRECEHDWNEPIYTWNEDNTKVTAKRVCKKDASHVETETVDVTSEVTKQPAGDELGVRTYTSGSFANPAFTVQTRTETISAEGHAHSWTEPTYEWAADNMEVKASRALTNNPSFVEVETVTPIITDVNPKCTEAGTRTYTASFKNIAFATQTRTSEIPAPGHTAAEPVRENEVAATCEKAGSYDEVVRCSVCGVELSREAKTIDPLGHDWGEPAYEWAADNGSVTATLTCKRDASHVQTETAKATSAATKEPTESEEGVKTYTATFANPAFETQIKTEPIPKLKPDEGVSYRNSEGDGLQWTKGSSATADFTFKRSVDDGVTFSHFTGIQVDGKDVDAANYTAEPGSVIVKLKPAYLETLAVGEHTLTAMFDDAGNVDARFEVLAAPAAKGAASKANSASAKTGDAMPVALLASLAVLSVAALLAVQVATRFRRSAHAGKRTRR